MPSQCPESSVTRDDIQQTDWCGLPLSHLQPHGLTQRQPLNEWLLQQFLRRPRRNNQSVVSAWCHN